MEYIDFVEFFNKNSKLFLNPYLFEKIATSLNKDTFQFFNFLIQNYSKEDIIKNIYYPFYQGLMKLKKLNAFYNEKSYYDLKNKIQEKEVTYVNCDVTKLREKFKEKTFDIILLSNIFDSAHKIYLDNPNKNFIRLIHSLSKLLKKQGLIASAYLYDYFSPHLHNELTAIFKPLEFELLEVDSYRFASGSDGVYLYRKKIK